MIAADDDQAMLAAAFATDKLNAKKIAIIHDKGDYGKGFADFCKEAIEKGGKAKVVVDGQTIATYDLYPTADVPAAGFFGRAWDSLRLIFH